MREVPRERGKSAETRRPWAIGDCQALAALNTVSFAVTVQMGCTVAYLIGKGSGHILKQPLRRGLRESPWRTPQEEDEMRLGATRLTASAGENLCVLAQGIGHVSTSQRV